MAFALFVAIEPALTFLTNFIFPTLVRPAEYYPFVTNLLFWTGVVFEIPIVTYFIAAMGFVRADVLLRSSRFVIVGLAVLAAAITPTTDPINMFIILVPLVALYFVGVGLAFLAQRARDRRLATAAQ
jgi:sec-independent protein translocase protein TatC